MPRAARLPHPGRRLYEAVAERELAMLRTMEAYYRAAVEAARTAAGDPPPAGAALARPEELEPELERARSAVKAFEEAVRARRPLAIEGRALTGCLAELGFELPERFGGPERRPGRWLLHPDGRYEAVPGYGGYGDRARGRAAEARRMFAGRRMG